MSDATQTVEVSVIIPCHNATMTLGLQLEALAEQVTAPPFEVIVSDNGSTDGLEEFLRPWRDRLALYYVDAGRLKGAAFARNVGMSVASADKWLFCDSDDVVARDWVAQGSAALDEVEVFSGPGLKVSADGLKEGLDAAWLLLDSDLPPGRPVQVGRLVAWPILLGGNSGFRREAVLEIGGYDAGMGYGVEDNDLAVRTQLSGRAVAAAPGVRILYREREGAWPAYRASRAAGQWHMALCERHGLWDRSPHLRGGSWWMELPRCAFSGLRMAVVPSRRDWRGLVSRVGLAVGMWRGWWRFRLAKRLPDAAVGEGLLAASTPRRRAVVFMPGVLNGGGAERYAVATAAALDELGYDAVLATTETADRERVGQHFGIDLSHVTLVDISNPPTWLARMPQAVFNLAEEAAWVKAVKALRPELFVNCLYRSELVGVGVRNIYVCHFPHRLDEQFPGVVRRHYMGVVRRIRTRLLRDGKDFRDTYDVICANSQFTAEHVRDRWGVEPRILYPPCPSMSSAGQVRARQILVVGRMEPPVPGVPNKRLDVLVSAFAKLTDLHEAGWALHVVGACPPRSATYVDDLRARAAGAPVSFYPNADFGTLQDLYSISTIYWHAQGFGEDPSARPETQEHFGITTVEAMSAGGIPVVIDTAGPREIVGGIAGICRWLTIDELLLETRRLAALPEADLADLSRRCQQRASEFDADHFKARLADIVDGGTSENDPEWLTQGPVLLLSPHLDDALFSASEIIRRGEVEVWTVFAGEPDPPITTTWDRAAGFADSHQQVLARRLEDEAAFAGTKAVVRHLPCLDGAYTNPERRAADLELLSRELLAWVERRPEQPLTLVIPACAGIPVAESHVNHALTDLGRLADLPKPIQPVLQVLREAKHRAYLRRRRAASAQGLAINGDHVAVRDTALQALASHERVTVVLAEDLPYLWWQAADAQVSAVAARWDLKAVPGSFGVDRLWKRERIKHYASQLDVMDTADRRLASADTLPPVERFWVLSAPGGGPHGR